MFNICFSGISANRADKTVISGMSVAFLLSIVYPFMLEVFLKYLKTRFLDCLLCSKKSISKWIQTVAAQHTNYFCFFLFFFFHFLSPAHEEQKHFVEKKKLDSRDIITMKSNQYVTYYCRKLQWNKKWVWIFLLNSYFSYELHL